MVLLLFWTSVTPIDSDPLPNLQTGKLHKERIAPLVALKVVLLSDTHGHHRELTDLPDGDLLVFAGDLTYFGQRDQVVDFNGWLGTLPHRHKVVVAGNHDGTWRHQKGNAKDVVSIADLPSLLTNAHYLQDSGFSFRTGGGGEGGRDVHVWGSPWQPQYPGFETYRRPGRSGKRDKSTIADRWKLVPDDTTVLVTHTPPRGVMDGGGRGCADLASRIERLGSLRMVAFGHFHEYGTVMDRDGLIYVNCAITNGDYRVVHNAHVVSLTV